jgi:hypothetical protein
MAVSDRRARRIKVLRFYRGKVRRERRKIV